MESVVPVGPVEMPLGPTTVGDLLEKQSATCLAYCYLQVGASRQPDGIARLHSQLQGQSDLEFLGHYLKPAARLWTA